MRVARFGDNMREVAVTEGDKVEAQLRLGWAVNGYGIGDLAQAVQEAGDAEVDRLLAEYDGQYRVAAPLRRGGERRAGPAGGGAHRGRPARLPGAGRVPGLHHLLRAPARPGPAARAWPSQRLMADGYGFGAEGDWKTAALVRAMKVMGAGLEGGTSFMEDYTYHLDPRQPMVLGAHMLEVCSSIAADTPSLEMHPLSIGGKEDPARLVFDAKAGPAVNATVIDLGDRFRMVVNEVDAVPPVQPLPRLPVARALWVPRPSLKVAAAAWILAGGAHHSGYSQAVSAEQLEDFAAMAGMECVRIGAQTDPAAFIKELRWNEVYWHLAKGW